ncbi:MAG: RagB/SusD family nutrient uptake outer membrane protein [Dysgonamonadaceae bacterium]|jgi:hypothetical protein|nr:RagB/SusD family nutrient uptake outer membrane protein [Dysgonamonadaceae bacterium]
MKNIKIKPVCLLLSVLFALSACSYLDVVPDNIATIDNAFTGRTTAEKFLFTCYSYMPAHASVYEQAFTIADEFIVPYPQVKNTFYNDPFEVIAMGRQNVISPALNYWDGLDGGKAMFQGLRDCNTFFEKIDNVPGLSSLDKTRWIAEVKFLKAYYHYWLLRMYGPIPLIKNNMSISASIDELQTKREPVDTCFNYIIQLLDEAIPSLPLKLAKTTSEMGRITQPIALAVKAKILVEAASPLFNGNSDYTSFTDKDGNAYFNTTPDSKKWEKAAEACKAAVEACESAGFQLYEFTPSSNDKINEELRIQMSIRNSVADNNYNFNKEVIWANTNSSALHIQMLSTATLDAKYTANEGHRMVLAPSLTIAEMFYSKNGVPIDEDNDWISTGKYSDRYKMKTATSEYKYNISEGEQTATLNFDREIRFYANLSFDRNLWFGIGKYDMDDQWVLKARAGEPAGKRMATLFSATGYFCKKLANYQNNLLEGTASGYVMVDYPWPVIRIADLYLLYAEALNEVSGPGEEVYYWIDLVRKRAGLEGVVKSWENYAIPSRKTKPSTQPGLREIIQRERLIELANEGQRYWEIRRWKKAKEMWHNKSVQGWDIEQSDAPTYYRVRTIHTPQFITKNYLWPLREYDLSINPKLDQNPGW